MILSITIGVWVAAANQLQVPRELVEQALEEPARVAFQDITLREAVNRLTEQTGVRIDIAEDVLSLIPEGGQTRIRELDLTNEPLREGLAQMFSPLGMTVIIRNGYVEVLPKEALLCLGRRPTWEELGVLGSLNELSPGLDDQALGMLRTRVQFAVSAPDAWKMLAETIRNIGAGPGDEVLTMACEQLGLAWCVSDDKIVVGPIAEQNRRRLARTISLRMNYRPLVDVLYEIGQKIGTPVRAEPGAIASLPLQVQRSFSINASDAPAEFVLDKVAAHTGLAYLIGPEGVIFYGMQDDAEPLHGAAAGPSSPVAATQPDPYVGKLVVPLLDGTSMEWHIRMSELPQDLQSRRAEDLRRAFEQLRRQ
ncbi:MAG: hypothetical protein ACYTHJ_14075 [Planctomycetota bacterium]|jgi:hypothetical protein